MEKKIEDVKFQIKIIGEDIQETRDFIGDWKREKQETVEKRIPGLNAKQEQSYAILAEQYTEQFTTSQGIPRYKQELARCGSPVAVSETFASPLKQTETLLRQAEGKLIELRGDYNAVQHTSFAQLYRISDASDYGNTLRIVIFDEAFNKMDDDRIIESVRLLRKLELQAIVCTPPDKASDLQPVSDKTLLVHKEQVGKSYQSTVIEWSKEIGEKYES